MNWPLLVRRMCEAYPGLTPNQIGRMNRDQVWVLTCDEKDLLNSKFVTDEPEKLIELGIRESVKQTTWKQAIADLKARRLAKQNQGKSKRQRRRERVAASLAATSTNGTEG